MSYLRGGHAEISVGPKWALKLRLVRCYDLPAYGNKGDFSLECVFHDKEGERIHGTIKHPVMERVKPILKEGHIFAIKNIIVAENRMKYKTTTNKYKINFIAKSYVCEVFDDTFPTMMYEFKSFSELKNTYIDETILFDIIGKMVARDSPKSREFGGRVTKLLDFVMEDSQNNNLSCTLWGDFVNDMMTYLEKVGEEPVVIILQMCRAKHFMGEVRVSNTFHVTKMIVNGNLDEIIEFRNRITVNGKTTNSISTISAPSTQTIWEELSTAKDFFRTIEQVSENNEVGSFWVYARIVGVESCGNWSYLSCKKCPKKVTPVGDKFYCERCDHFDVTGNLRFKIQARVVDNTGNALFLLWDRECIELFGKTALELSSEMKNKDPTSIEVPKEFDDLVDQKVLFKVQVRPDQIRGFNGTYTVMKLTTDNKVIEKYGGEFFESQESDVFSKMKNAENEGFKEVTSSEDEVSTPLKSTSKTVISKDVMKETSLKRALIDEFSSTAPDKKLKTVIKQEKD